MYIQYSKTIRFVDDDFTSGGAVRPSALLHAFQDIAGEHAETAGLGFDDLIAQDLIWVITKSRFILEGRVVPGKDYTLLTFPRRTTSLIYDRDFYLLDGGSRLAVGTSAWCVVNYVTRHAAQTGLDFKGVYTTDKAIPEGIPRLRPKTMVPAGTHTVARSDLDKNNHMNNCRYADLALEVLGIDHVRELTMNFANETRLGDVIELFRCENGIAAGTHEGKVIFTAKASGE